MTTKLTQLGSKASLPPTPGDAVIEVIDDEYPRGAHYVVRFTVPEFTSLCPITGQPDFARFVIDYVPASKLIESKSLKLFMSSFRNHGAFHEDVTVEIGKRLWSAAMPVFMRVCAFWYPRGGIPIDVFWQEGQLPEHVYLPEPGAPAYTGR